jgi:hypothetical protein
MNMLVASLTFVPLLVVAFAHFLWSIGYTWPIRSEDLLVRTVVGTAGATRMPNRGLMLLAAVAVLAAGIVALALADPVSGGIVLDLAGLVLAAVFAARGVLAYTPAWRAKHPVEPFAALDRRNYAPLCFWVGAGFLILVLMRLL